MNPGAVSIGSLLQRSYQDYASLPAVGDTVEQFTYGELGDRVQRLWAGLRERGVTKGDRVVILSKNSTAMVEFDHACFRFGLVRVALSTRLHPLEVVGICNDCTPTVLALDERWAEDFPSFVDRLAVRPLVVTLADGAAGSDLSLSDLTSSSSNAATVSTPPPAPDDLAAILYTSGTTGRPKGAMLSHRNWLAMIRNSMVELPPITQADVVLHVGPYSHLSGYLAYTYFARGASHIVWPSFEPPETLALIERYRVTTLPLVPTMLNMLVEEFEGTSTKPDLSSLVTILYAGSSISPARLARAREAFGDVLVQFYGLSEIPMPLTALSTVDHLLALQADDHGRLGSAGRPSPFVELEIRDEVGKEVGRGTVGEIAVRGESVMAGYWNMPEETAEMVKPDGWAHTGDLGRIDDEGYLEIVDRKKDMIITGGFNVYPREVEDVIQEIPTVSEAVVVGVPDDKWGEAIKAVVVPIPGATVTLAEIKHLCSQRLARHKIPRSLDIVAELPKTGSGKVKRREVRDGYRADRGLDQPTATGNNQ